MTILSSDPYRLSLGDGVTPVFAAPYVLRADDLDVYVGGVLQAASAYVVSNVGVPEGSIVTMVAVPALNVPVLRIRNPDILQGAIYQDSGKFPSGSHAREMDRRAMIEQAITYLLQHSVRVPPGKGTIAALDLAGNASKMLGVNPAGDAIGFYALGAGVPAVADLVTYNPSWANAITTSVRDRLMRQPSFEDFAGGNDTARAVNALAAVPVVTLLAGKTYQIDAGALTSGANGVGLHGPGRHACKVQIFGTTEDGIAVGAGLNNVSFKGFTLEHGGTPSAGSWGIDARNTLGMSQISDLIVRNFYGGILLGPTDTSTMHDVIVEKCLGIGVQLQNDGLTGTLQWDLNDVGVQKCDGDGFKVVTTGASGQVTMGDLDNIWTFANTGYGFNADAVSTMPINGVRPRKAFMGENGKSGFRLNTYGRLNVLSDCIAELAGRVATGRTLATAASGDGHGLEITANNVQVAVDNLMSDANSKNGADISGGSVVMNSMKATNNGQAGIAGDKSGIRVKGTALVSVDGGQFEYQDYALRAAVGANVAWDGAPIARNLGIALWLADDGATIQTIGALPASNLLLPKGGVVVGTPTGGALGDGTINADIGVYKDGVAFTNP